MAQFYVSHAYEDRGFANTLIAWLKKHAFSSGVSTFVKTPRFTDNQNHPTQAVNAIRQSDAVVMLCSKNWAACKQCYAEYVAAQAAGKFVIALMIKKAGQDLALAPDIPRFTIDKVGHDLADLIGVLTAFERADPQSYEWTPGRRPYPGVRAFNCDEAGVFFGRNSDIQIVVARISAQLLRETNDMTILVGPTGSGVSSLLSAGVLPALARNSADNFILPVMRPRVRPIDALAVSIATAMNTPDNWRRWSDRLTRATSDDLAGFIERCVAELREHAANPNARILLPVDQLEELFEVSEPEQARSFEAFIAVASASDLGIHVVSTLGSGQVRTFKRSRLGVCNWKPITIEPIPLERYSELIREPAQRAGLDIEDDLVQRIVADAAELEEDRLSLVAYLLRLFWRLESPFGRFSHDLYDRLSNGDLEMPTLQAAIAVGAELAIEDAEAGFEARQSVGPMLANLAVRWDVHSNPVRTPFALEEVPREQIEVLDRMEQAGLVSKVKVGEQHLGEISSDALFRRWPRLERLLRAQSEGPDIVVSHCREVSCVVLQPETETVSPKGLWHRAGSLLSESMTGALCVLVGLVAMGSLQTDGPRDESGPHIVASLASPIDYLAPAPSAPQRGETDNPVTEPAGGKAQAPEAFADMKPPHTTAQQMLGPVLQPPILPSDVLLKIMLSDPPQASGAQSAQRTMEDGSGQTSPVELPDLLELVRTQPASENGTTQMLLALEALLHPKASLLTGQQGTRLRQVIQENLERHLQPRSFRTHDGRVFAASFSPTGKFLAAASKDGVARLWNVESGAEIGAFDSHTAEIYGVAYSRDGSRLVTTSRDRTARIWSTKSGAENTVLKGHKGAVYRASFGLDGTQVVTASADGLAIIWDTQSGEKLRALKGHLGPVWSAVYSDTGGEVLTTSKDRTARIWSTETGHLVRKLEGHKADVVTGSFSPDGKKIATGSRDGSVIIWEASTGRRITELLAHSATVFSARFSNDGMFLVTASFDGTARIWELATGRKTADFNSSGGEMRHAELTSDGRFLRTVSDDGTVSIWPVTLTTNRLLDDVLRATKGCLSTKERRALNLPDDMPWWCQLSSASPNYDVARTEQ